MPSAAVMTETGLTPTAVKYRLPLGSATIAVAGVGQLFFIGGHVAKAVTILTLCYFLFYPFKPQCPKSLFEIGIGLLGLGGCQLVS